MNRTKYTPHSHALLLTYHSNVIPVTLLARLNVMSKRCVTIDRPCCPTRRCTLSLARPALRLAISLLPRGLRAAGLVAGSAGPCLGRVAANNGVEAPPGAIPHFHVRQFARTSPTTSPRLELSYRRRASPTDLPRRSMPTAARRRSLHSQQTNRRRRW